MRKREDRLVHKYKLTGEFQGAIKDMVSDIETKETAEHLQKEYTRAFSSDWVFKVVRLHIDGQDYNNITRDERFILEV